MEIHFGSWIQRFQTMVFWLHRLDNGRKAHSREPVVGTMCLAYCGGQVGVEVRVLRLSKLFKGTPSLFHPVKPFSVKIPSCRSSPLNYDFLSVNPLVRLEPSIFNHFLRLSTLNTAALRPSLQCMSLGGIIHIQIIVQSSTFFPVSGSHYSNPHLHELKLCNIQIRVRPHSTCFSVPPVLKDNICD